MIVFAYFIMTLIIGAFITYCSAVRDPDFKNNIQDKWWWSTVAIMALIWPIVVLQLIAWIIGRIIRSI